LDKVEVSEPRKAAGRRGARDRKQANKNKGGDELQRRVIEDSLMKYEKEVDLMHREEVLGRNDEQILMDHRSISRSSEMNINQGTQGEAQRNSYTTVLL
jgi:hypothetical protein